MKIILFILLSLNFLYANTNLNTASTKISEVTTKDCKIYKGDIKIGQSGIIVQQIGDNSIILNIATVTQSNDKFSIVKFINNNLLPQDSIATSKRKPQNGDMFVLNHLYNTSLMIVPNTTSKNILKEKYPNQNFLNEDYFAAHLKLTNTPIPKKEDIQEFTKNHQIGTIFIVIKNDLYILDSLTFKVIDTINLDINNNETKSPFLTKIKEIERGFWDFGEEKIANYNKYYSRLLGI
ncbi:MAG: plasminogen-binding N-terminal domain-containing protein [Campylobacterota bacterium]|nr:plasminogen-binding N-terminal domain-containing protein [Campylobacterota bacterium]